MNLATVGIGQLTLLDDNVVNLSNIRQQTLYKETELEQRSECCSTKAILSNLSQHPEIFQGLIGA